MLLVILKNYLFVYLRLLSVFAAGELSLALGHRFLIACCRAQASEQVGFSSYGERAQ